jgi:hypothetical protein
VLAALAQPSSSGAKEMVSGYFADAAVEQHTAAELFPPVYRALLTLLARAMEQDLELSQAALAEVEQ